MLPVDIAGALSLLNFSGLFVVSVSLLFHLFSIVSCAVSLYDEAIADLSQFYPECAFTHSRVFAHRHRYMGGGRRQKAVNK
ncbi:hypothetical protein EV360DRAFT_90943 [Lentinula raphanica]|nr:hypothetical protein EV360DRAFT_90943 [Lentinula raphanica]